MTDQLMSIEYCLAVEAWSQHADELECGCDYYDPRKCQYSEKKTCNCECHLINKEKNYVRVDGCRSCMKLT